MPKTTAQREVFLTGGNRADGSRFERGDAVPRDLTTDERKALIAIIGTADELAEDK